MGQTLEFKSNYVYSMDIVEGRRLPELDVTLKYDGKQGRKHVIVGKIKILYAGDTFLGEMPQRLKTLKETEMATKFGSKAEAVREAMEDADVLIAEFLASGLFGIAVLDATDLNRGVYEYVPELRVESAKVTKVK